MEIVNKSCTKCNVMKHVGCFYRLKHGKMGRHSYCKTCFDLRDRKPDSPEVKTKNNLTRRYGLTPKDVADMKAEQSDACAICKQEKRLVVDHCHATNKVRALLCHKCNIFLHAVEDKSYLVSALFYLECHRAVS